MFRKAFKLEASFVLVCCLPFRGHVFKFHSYNAITPFSKFGKKCALVNGLAVPWASCLIGGSFCCMLKDILEWPLWHINALQHYLLTSQLNSGVILVPNTQTDNSTKQVEIPQRLFLCLKKIQAIHKPIFSSLHFITCDFESFVFLLALTLDDCTCFHFPFEGELRFNKKNFMIFAYYFWNTHIELATILQILDY